MDEPGAGIGGDEITGEERARARVKMIPVTPAKAGAHRRRVVAGGQLGQWVPAFAGMTTGVVKRVAGDGAGKVGADAAPHNAFIVIPACAGMTISMIAGKTVVSKDVGQQQRPAIMAHGDIRNLRPIGDRLVDRDRPWRRRPDHRICADQFRNR